MSPVRQHAPEDAVCCNRFQLIFEKNTVHEELTNLYLAIVLLAEQVRDSLDQEEDWLVVLVRYGDGLSRFLSDEDVESSCFGRGIPRHNDTR